MKIGDRIRDNDPRSNHRVLTITGFGMVTEAGVQRVRAKPVNGREVSIGTARIYADGKPRRTGFSVVTDDDDQVREMIGMEIKLIRGSRGRTQGPGMEREVRAVLDGVENGMVFATLLEDDPMATVKPTKAGDSGVWHGLSFVKGLAGV